MLTSRIDQLKKQFFTHVPAVCLEGALSKTHVFKETEGEPMIVRRAKAFKRHCETKTITIQPGELVVGNAGRTARTIHICPELSNNWVYEELDTMATRPQDPYAITEEQKMLFRNEIYPYWKGKTLRDYWNAQAPKPILDIISVGGVIDNDIKIECTPGDIVPEFKENIFAKGFGGIRAQAQALLETVDLNDVENYDRRDFWEAITITCDGFSILCRRHAQAARELAATERDGTRKAELLGMAEACDAIAENPPKTFREAMQLHYFIFVGLFYTGDIKTNGIFGALANGSSLRALDTAFILASISAIIMGMISKVWNFKKALSTFIEGCTGMMEVLMILMLAWGIGSICSACGTSTWIVNTCESFLTPTSMCAIIFIAACLTSFSTGSSWSVFAIFIPIAVSLAISIGAPVGMAIGVVLSGGIFGDHCSPISDTTVMSSMGSSCDHIDHVRTQLPYALTVAGSSLVGYIVSGLMKGGAFVGLAITLVLICLVSFLLNKHVGRGKDAKASQDAA